MRPPASRPWPTGAEFYGLRAYQPGYDVRAINWRALGRTDQYLVREAEHGITGRTWVILDTAEASFPHPDDDARRPSFECAVRTAASVALAHLRANQSGALHVGADARELTRGTRGEFELMDTLARVDVDATPLSGVLWGLVRAGSFGHVVVATARLTPEVVRLVNVLVKNRSSVTMAVVGENTDPMTNDLLTALRSAVVLVPVDGSVQRSFARPLAGAR